MKINVLRKMKYESTYIYVIQFDYCFQYLFSIGPDIYQNHVFLVPRLWKRMLYRLGLVKNLYNKEQLEEGEKIVLSGAMKSIDELSKKKEEPKEKPVKHKQSGECLWTAREGKDGMYYLCMTHNQAVSMEDGVKPTHNLNYA